MRMHSVTRPALAAFFVLGLGMTAPSLAVAADRPLSAEVQAELQDAIKQVFGDHAASKDILHGRVHREKSMDYKISAAALAQGHMQMSVEGFDKGKLPEKLRKYDVTGLSAQKKVDYITVAKSAYLFKGVGPSFFQHDMITSEGFLNAAMQPVDDSKIVLKREIGADGHCSKVHMSAPKGWGKMSVDLRTEMTFAAYDFNEPGATANMTVADAQKLLDANFEAASDTPDVVTMLQAKPENFSQGARTVNYYYGFKAGGEDYTLHISYKVTTFTCEGVLNLPFVWGTVKSKAHEEQYQGTLKSLDTIQEFRKSLR